ncbi:MAG: 50S rRNA methyltransferase [Caldilineaceae bacterium]|nr:50S rRNA methyltransferase [Caldilineaceae bacterium]
MSDAALGALEAQAYQHLISADEGSLDLALKELYAVDGKATVGLEFAPGVLLINGSLSFADLAAAWAEKPPIFVRHVAPVQSVLTLDEGADWRSLVALVAAEEILPHLDPSMPFSVQSRIFPHVAFKPFEVNQLIAQVGVEQFGLTLDVRQPEQVISVAVRSEAGEPPTFYLGASPTAHNLSDWAGGMRRFAREEGQISRAEFKLLEAIDIFGLELPARGTALDLGAAPGGWTRVLRNFEQYVTAVDPGDLDPRLASDRGVRHKRMTAETYLDSGPDPFDIIVNDMRMDGRDSARLMTSYARLLYPHGWALMTLKLPELKRESILEHTFAILRNRYTIAGARQLFHNRSEITIYLRPLKNPSAST